MSATPSKLFVGIIGFILSVYLYSGVGIAEQIVDTESHVVLEVGTRGILPCRIQKRAYLIQWKIEVTSEHLLVYLNPYTNVDLRGGPGYTEGLFNITEDYSLIIKDVKVQDEGLYVCEVSDFQTGKVFRNKTRVSVRGTGVSVALEMGAQGILPCRIQRGAYEVEWRRQLSSDMSETELLVSLDQFFTVGKRDGPGYERGLFNITDDYSLVIKDVKVQDEGLYICTLFDYKTGGVFRNSTRVYVQAFPEEPFPIIQECVGKDVNPGVCTLTVHSTSNLTCFVMGYYPDINLFFLHGSETMKSTRYEEWNNADGTKNSKLRVHVSISYEPYECVASSLSGIVGKRSVSVIVQFQDRPRAKSQDVTIAVVLAVTVVICVSILIFAIFKYHRGNGRGWSNDYSPVAGGNSLTYLKAPKGPISKLELWQMIKNAEQNNDFERLRKVVHRLLNDDALLLQKDLDFYKSLCTWKSEMSPSCNQRDELYSACCDEGMTDTARKVRDVVMDSSQKVSRIILRHILWEIKETSKITELLRSLGLNHQSVATAAEKGRREVVYRAHRELMEWRKRKFDINSQVILSLKLDGLEGDTDFFKIPVSEMEEIDIDEMRGRSFDISNQHFKHLLKAFKDVHGEDGVPYQIESLVQENNESLLDTIQMLQDWVQNEQCSNYEARKKLRKGVKASLQRDHTADKWPPDDELRVIASFLSPASMGLLCAKIGIKRPPQESSKEERFQALAEWRDSHASSKDFLEKHTEFITALKEVEREGLIPRVKGPFVYKAELVDLAFHLFAQDLLPFTQALGISAAKLVDYRPTFQPSHMTKGTIGLVCKHFESGDRSHLLKLIKEMPYPNVFASAMLALEISFQEVCVISVGTPNCQKIEGMRPPFNESTPMPPGDHDSSMGTTEKKLSLPPAKPMHIDETFDEGIQPLSENEVFSDIMTLLTSSNQVIDYNQVSPESSAFLQRFKVWREQPRLISLNFRLALANCLRREDNSEFFRGECKKGIIPFTFIHNILQTMDPKQRFILRGLIADAPFHQVSDELEYTSTTKEEWFKLTEAVSTHVFVWTKEWIKEIIHAQGKTAAIAKKHKDFNDKLVDHGFIDLAREIMIIEQQPIDAQ